jgi:hypothetical protein
MSAICQPKYIELSSFVVTFLCTSLRYTCEGLFGSGKQLRQFRIGSLLPRADPLVEATNLSEHRRQIVTHQIDLEVILVSLLEESLFPIGAMLRQ